MVLQRTDQKLNSRIQLALSNTATTLNTNEIHIFQVIQDRNLAINTIS